MRPEEHGQGYVPLPAAEVLRGAKYAAAPPVGANLNELVGVTPSRTEDQLRLNACAGHAVTSALECMGVPVPQLSRRDVWERAKRAMGITGNVGVYLNVACDQGIAAVAAEADWPYDDQYADQADPTGLVRRHDPAIAHRLITGNVVEGIWAALKRGHPVVIGVGIDGPSFYDAFSNGGVVKTYNRDRSRWDVWHAMYIHHWLPQYGAGEIGNSWGEAIAPALKLVKPDMRRGDLLMTGEVMEACLFEARELDPDSAQIPPPAYDFCEVWPHSAGGGYTGEHFEVGMDLAGVLDRLPFGGSAIFKRQASDGQQVFSRWFELSGRPLGQDVAAMRPDA